MKFALEIVPFGAFGDARTVMRVAQAAEAAGWDGLFVWDHLAYAFGYDGGDAWVILSAAAAVTERIKLGTTVTPLPRRRPQVLAQTLVTLDRLSNGRLIFAAGAGGTEVELEAFGEPTDPKRRAAMLDEGLLVLDGLLRGEKVDFYGEHYTVNGVTLAPRPVQQPRPRIWIGGGSKAALRRAARWDGWSAGGVDENCRMVHPPEWFAEQIAYIQQQRAELAGSSTQNRSLDKPFDVAVSGCTAPGDSALPRSYADAGATWWFENIFGLRGTVDEMLDRVHAGPPR